MTQLICFFAISFTVAWSLWLAWSATQVAWLRGLFLLLGTFTPGFVALGMTAWGSGRKGLAALLQRIVDWELPARWFLFAAGYIAVIKLTVAALHRILTGEWPPFGQTPWYLMIVATAFSTMAQAGEELGWRGYALPRLGARVGFGSGSLLLGVVWAVWHLPLFLLPGTDTTGQSFPLYLLQVTALSVAMTWLYVNTRGSLLAVMLMHAAVNNTKDIVPSAEPGATNPWALSRSLPAWLTVALLWLCAIYFLFRLRGRLVRKKIDAEPVSVMYAGHDQTDIPG